MFDPDPEIQPRDKMATPIQPTKDQMIDAALNLLAVIHRDGGHATESMGFIESCTVATEIVYKLMSLAHV